MKWSFLLLLLVVAAVFTEDVLPAAGPCDPEACQLPSCRCSSTTIPGDLDPRDTPQFVVLTFDDAVNVLNVETYRADTYGRRNKNGCPIGVTFYANHEYTNYQLVNELYNQGFEIALHSITHQTPQTYWAEASTETLMREIADQRTQMSHFAAIPANQIRGVRLPFLQMAGNNSFEMMAQAGLLYDSSWPTTAYTDPGLWPYTLDYASTQDCVVQFCPTASIPGPWVFPMVAWSDLQDSPCSMMDACFYMPPLNDEEEWFSMMMKNFERHYLGNRAPFGFYVHEWFISSNPAVRRAFNRLLDVMNNLNDVFMVNAGEVIDWVRDPKPLSEYVNQGCRQPNPASCIPRTCGPLTGTHNELQYWMTVCSACPRTYPWLGNPLGA